MKTIYCIFIFMSLTFLTGCQDEELDPPLPVDQPLVSRAVNNPSALVQNADRTWTANKRVPLVGQGRIIDDMSSSLIAVLNTNGGIANMLDTNLENAASFSGAVTADLLGNQIASVRDINHVYAGGQVAGFVYKIADTKLLTADVLKGFWLKTFLNGQEQETKGGDTSVTTLALNVLSAGNNDGKQAVSLSTSLTKPFDEIKIGMAGISAQVLGNLSLYYAFVGENPIKPAITNGTYYPSSAIHYDVLLPSDLGWTSTIISTQANKLVNSDLTDGATFGTLAGLLSDPYITVNLNATVPAGSEIGFYTSSVDLLSINIAGGVQLTTYDSSNKKVEEITVNSLLGISALAGGGSQISMITKKPCSQVRIKYNGINVSLSATTVHYAFVRDPIVVDPSSYFSLSDATISSNYYQLSAPTDGTVTWVLTGFPSGAVPTITGNKITGMTANGPYSITGTYTKDGVSITQSAIITRSVQGMSGTNCNTLIGTAYNATPYQPGGGGSLITIYDKAKNIANLTDDNPDNYATYQNVLSLLANTSIVGIQTGKYINDTGANIRTGFTMQTSQNLLGANALKFLLIRLYDNNTLVFQSAADGSKAVSAGLIGNSGSKVRFSVNTNVKFNKIELWTAGVLNLNLNEFRLYNAFWEPTASTCPSDAATEACIELLTPSTYGASINYAATKTEAVATVGGSFNNLGNLLDSSESTYATVTYTNVIGKTSVAVKFNEMPANRPIGFIVKNPAYLANINLLSATILEVYNKGVKVGSTTDGGVLGLDVIGYTERIYVQTIPTVTYDEVRITFPAVAGVLDTTQLFGVYTRQDTDGDGIPDCAEDDNNPSSSITNAAADTEHVCANSDGKHNVIINVTGGTVGTTYSLNCYNYGNNNALTTQNAALTTAKTLTVTNLPTGDYYISIVEGSQTLWNGIHAAIHPLQSTWKTNAASTDWNTWSNWSNGSPWRCTNVIIPTNSVRYPTLNSGDQNLCANIHFAPGAEVVNTQYLTYDQAWVEVSLTAGRYYMLSAPLKDMVTGDMFIPASLNGNQGEVAYFTQLDASSSPENRFSPRIYQRLWSNNAPGKKFSGGILSDVQVTPDVTRWTSPFNALKQAYKAGEGFSLLADKEKATNNTLTFRFPKVHTTYTYFNASGSGSSYTETGISRPHTGRFIYENNDGTAPSSFTITLTNQQSGTTFLAGNMFMAHIDIAKFLAKNTSITSIKVYDGNTNNSLIAADGTLLSNNNGYAYIAPMQSFFVTTGSASTSLTLNYTYDMLTQAPGSSVSLRSYSRAAAVPKALPTGTLQLSASTGNVTANSLVRISPKASNAYHPDEETEMLTDNEMSPIIALYTVADGKALDIQQIKDATHIPIGFHLRSADKVTLTLTHADGDAWKNWQLIDTQTGEKYPLNDPELFIDLGTLSTHVGRFYLEKNNNR